MKFTTEIIENLLEEAGWKVNRRLHAVEFEGPYLPMGAFVEVEFFRPLIESVYIKGYSNARDHLIELAKATGK